MEKIINNLESENNQEQEQPKQEQPKQEQPKLEQDFILLIMNCKKYIKKALYQKITWLKLLPPFIKYYHVIGDETLDEEYKFNEYDNLLWVKTKDDYVSLPNKVISSYNAINNKYNFKYIFKTDDDQILINPKFLNMISSLVKIKKPTPHYGGYVVNVEKPYLSEYYKIHPELPKTLPILKTKYCSGRFYFLSKDAVSYLLTKRENIIKEYLEDFAIGFHLSPYYKNNILDIKTNDYFTDIELSDFPMLVKEGKI